MFSSFKQRTGLILNIRPSVKAYSSSTKGQTNSFLKLDEVLKTELKKRQLQSAETENDEVIKDIKMKQYLDNQVGKNLNMVRGVRGGTQIKVQSNLNLFNNSLSANNASRFNESLSMNSLGKEDNYKAFNSTKLVKKAAITAVNSVSSRNSLRAAFNKIRSIHDSTNKTFHIKLRQRHMRPCKVKRQKNMYIGSKKFDEGFSDYMSTTYALLRRGYGKE